jgi:hypothetical protein
VQLRPRCRAIVICGASKRAALLVVTRIPRFAPSAAPLPKEGHAGVAAFQQVLQQLGWTDGQNLRIDTRWGENDVDRGNRYAAELVALAPDIILGSGTVSVTALQRATRTLPIVFVQVSDPVGSGRPRQRSKDNEAVTTPPGKFSVYDAPFRKTLSSVAILDSFSICSAMRVEGPSKQQGSPTNSSVPLIASAIPFAKRT